MRAVASGPLCGALREFVLVDYGRIIDIGTPADLVRRHCPERTVIVATEAPTAPERFRTIPQVQAVSGLGLQLTIRGRRDDLVTSVIQCLAEHRMPVIEFRTEARR
jgi:ABC-2 type transport system ATP-binding protein